MTDAAVPADEWRRSIDDPFGSDAVEMLTKLTPSPSSKPSSPPSHPPTSPQPREEGTRGTRIDSAEAFMSRLDAAAFPLSSSTASSSASSSSVTPRSGGAGRSSFYEEDEEAARSSQEDTVTQLPLLRRYITSPAAAARLSSAALRTSAASTATAPPRPSSRAPEPSLLTPSAPLKLARSETWLHAEQPTHADLSRSPSSERENSLLRPSTASEGGVGGEMGAAISFGFTSGSGKRVEISAAALARGAQIMREVEEKEEQQGRANSNSSDAAMDDAPLQSIKSASKMSLQQPPSFGFKTPARISRPPSTSNSASPGSRSTAGLDALPSFGGFTTAAGSAVPQVSAASLARAKALIEQVEAEAEEATPPVSAAPAAISFGFGVDDGAGADLLGGFSTGSGKKVAISEAAMRQSRVLFQELEEQEEQLPLSAHSSMVEDGTSSLLVKPAGRKSIAPFPAPEGTPPPSSFKSPARQPPRPSSVASSSFPPLALPPESSSARSSSQSVPPPPPPGRKSVQFDAFLDALSRGDTNDDAVEDGLLLLPPVGGLDEAMQSSDLAPSAAAALNGSLALFNGTADVSSFSPPPAPASPTSTAPERAPMPTDGLGLFMTGKGRAIEIRPESLAKAQQLLDSADKQNVNASRSTDSFQDAASRRPLASLQVNLAQVRALAEEAPPLLKGRTAAAKENVATAVPLAKPDSILPPLARPLQGASATKPALPGPRPFRPPVAIRRPSLVDSPLPSPGSMVGPRRAEQRRAAPDMADVATNKKRRLGFNTPRPHVTAKTVPRTDQAADADEPSLLRSSKKPPSVNVGTVQGKRGALAAATPSLPVLEAPTSTLPFHCAREPLERFSEEELLARGVPEEVIRMTATSALDYVFPASASTAGVPLSHVHVYHQLLQLGCDPSLLSQLWVRNHYRWIVWKLASYERSFPSKLGGQCLTYFQLIKQLRCRYERELEQAKRSALALILERDESAARYLVLCIAAILPDPQQRGEGEEDSDVDDADTAMLLHTSSTFRSTCHLVLTDGHYSVPAKLDPPLLDLLHRNKLHVGCTLRIFNASLGGGPDAVAPLENESVYLELRANSVRPGRRGYRLGLQRGIFSVSLRGVVDGGGGLPCVYAVVGRVYPLLYMEMHEDGSKTHRTQRAEDTADEAWNARMEKRMDERRMDWEARMDNAAAASQFHSTAASSSSSMREEGEAMDEEQVEPRKVIPYMKLRLHELIPPGAAPIMPNLEREDGGIVEHRAPVPSGDSAVGVLSGCEAMLTVWRPSEADLEMLVEGACVSIYGAQVSGRFDGVLRLANSRSTRIVPLQSVAPFHSLRRKATRFIDLQSMQPGDEFDCCGNVLLESRYTSSPTSSTTRHLYAVHDTEELLMVELVESDSLALLPSSALQTPVVTLFTALRYGNYDRVRRVHVAHAGLLSNIRLRAAGGVDEGGQGRRALVDAWTECKRWFDSTSGQEVARMQRERVRRLVEGEDEGGCESDAWYEQLRNAIQTAEAGYAKQATAQVHDDSNKPKPKQRLLLGKAKK